MAQTPPQALPEEELKTARHFTSAVNAMTDLQADLQAMLNLTGRLRMEKANLEKALDKAIERQDPNRKLSKAELLGESIPKAPGKQVKPKRKP